ncbi:MAG TPA: 3-hydroxybutyryl-CoA dehydrogenase [Lachnospiraceae bacterium]|nr:3-hydroxybutyryl-CoA dehydrogenase [Lachnospiraceae bacterium]
MEAVGVVGAGTMGSGVALNLVQKGFRVVITDISEKVLEKSRHSIYQNLRLQRLYHNSKLSPINNIEELMDNIIFTTDYQKFGDVTYIIENVTENLKIKQEVYAMLEKVCGSDTIFIANTSSISIGCIASYTNRPEKVMGVHFMNPVVLKEYVEGIQGPNTSMDCICKTEKLLLKMGKKLLLVKDSPGFVSNRISHLYMNEAFYIIEQQIASVEIVDEIFSQCFGHAMGPLETADLIGLDVVMDTLNVMYEAYKDRKYLCCPLLVKMVEEGRLGRKSGCGFYQY